ncbi:hypothetical protein FISHEDRAFT_72657 [Fistulina hepatica ATCC 64428]|nr:hypothetical protein FISHEDRAFT_72657 [Fistulina hepatica ATCC 64428]
MSDQILQHVLEDIRPHIIPKLKAEADAAQASGSISAKKLTVDTHRGENYQFCYFLRKTQPHSVVIKTRNFILRKPEGVARPPSTASRKRKEHCSPATSSQDNPPKKRNTKGKSPMVEADVQSEHSSDEDVIMTDAARHSSRARSKVAGGYREPPDPDDSHIDVDDDDDNDDNNDKDMTAEQDEYVPDEDMNPPEDVDVALDDPFDLVVEEEEVKPKPILRVQYHNFMIYGHCLCIVVEPWPPMRGSTRTPSVAPIFNRDESVPRAASVAPIETSALRGKTPLFLPDYTHDRRETPFRYPSEVPSEVPRRSPSETPVPHEIPRVPLFYDAMDEDDAEDNGGMMELSQVLFSIGDYRATEAEDNEDIDGAVFFGDADEVRGLS